MTESRIIELAKEAGAWDVSGGELMLFSKQRIIDLACLLEKEIKNDEKYSTNNC